MVRRNLGTVEGDAPGRRGVMYNGALEAQITGRTGRGMHTHECHHARQDKVLDPLFL